jgi:hypothetical protein
MSETAQIDEGATVLRHILARATELADSGDSVNYLLAEKVLADYVDAVRKADAWSIRINLLQVILLCLVLLTGLLVAYQQGWINGYKYRANQPIAQKQGGTL